MAETPGSNSDSWRQSLTLAKILLRKHGILHGFHVTQLENYPIACCKISLDGSIEIDADRKLVTFTIKTLRNFKREDKEIVPRAKYSPFGKIEVPDDAYEQECKMAVINLNTWTKELLWGADETTVKVIIDGRECK